MSTPKVPRRLVRIDEDIYQDHLRPAAYNSDTDVTKLVNHILRHAIPIALSGQPGTIPPFWKES